LNNNITPADYVDFNAYVAAWQARWACVGTQFISFQESAGGGNSNTTTTQSKDENMNTEFNTERNSLKRVYKDAFYAKAADLSKEHNILPHHATSVREYISMIKDGQYDEMEDKLLDRKLSEYDDASHYISLRKHKADQKAHDATLSKIEKEGRDLDLRITIDDPKDALPKVEYFRDVTCKLHTVH